MTFIQDVTLNTGRNRPYNRFECRPETINTCKGLIEFALTEKSPVSLPVGEWSHLRFDCKLDGRKLLLTVYAPAAPHIPGKPYNGDNIIPILLCGIAPKSKDAKLWHMLTDVYQQVYKSAPEAKRPQAPWMGTVVLPTLEQYLMGLPLLADFTRCMAWAWLEISK